MTEQHLRQQTPLYRPLRWFLAWVTLCVVLLASTAPARAADAWKAVGGAGFSGDGAWFTSLALDASGVPYVAYTDASNSNKATVMRLNGAGTGWEAVGGTGFSVDAAWFISLVFDPSGVPYVAYQDENTGSKATVMRLNAVGTGWEVVGGAGFSDDYVVEPSLAFDLGGRPYVAYQDAGNGNKATVMRLNAVGTGWEVVGGAGFSDDYVAEPLLAFDSGGRPYVAYRDGGKGNKVTVMRLNAVGTGWEVVGGAGFSVDAAFYLSLALDSSGRPYVAYQDAGNGNKATAMRLNAVGTGWEVVGGAGFSVDAAFYLSLALDSSGRPYVAYQDAGNGNKATAMRLNAVGTGWEVVGGAGFSVDRAYYISLALNSSGRPYMAYQDAGNGNKATVMQWRTAPSTPAAPTLAVGSNQVAASWLPPTDNGGSAVLSYTATASPSSASCEATAPATSCVITGLTMGQTYTFSVTATNAQGTSPASAPSAAVTLGAPTRTAQAIPMLNAWALAGLALALAALSALALRRRAS